MAKIEDKKKGNEDDIKSNVPENDGSLEKNGIYLFMNEVTDSTVKPVIEWVLRENLRDDKNKKEYLHLIVNSPGGSVPACFALLDVIFGSRIPIYTTGIGEIASCGLLIFMSGTKGHRTLTSSTSILLHQYSWGAGGKHHELVAARKEQDLTMERILRLYKKCTGMSEKEIKRQLDTPHDNWMTPKEAKAFGICDHIKDFYTI